ncbi:MAG TPA: hypothetical protein VGN01_20570 [Acidobacteriaceae bacterium]|jgi:hypothetical protein
MTSQEMLIVDADEFALEGGRIAGALDSLSYVIHSDDETGLVGLYARQLEGRVRDLEVLMNCIDPNMRAVRTRLRN